MIAGVLASISVLGKAEVGAPSPVPVVRRQASLLQQLNSACTHRQHCRQHEPRDKAGTSAQVWLQSHS